MINHKEKIKLLEEVDTNTLLVLKDLFPKLQEYELAACVREILNNRIALEAQKDLEYKLLFGNDHGK